ncbi:MAG: 4'-phosphopantetheinyl transferase family protein [Bacilli bacterium]
MAGVTGFEPVTSCSQEGNAILVADIQMYWVQTPCVGDMATLELFLDILDEKEQQVYRLFRADPKKIEFLIGRLLLKTLVSDRLQIDPRRIHFGKNKYGKLLLDDRYYETVPDKVYFNLSHTDNMVVCAFTTHGEVGIDVERTDRDHLIVMPTLYMPHEIAYVDAQCTISEKFRAFYLLWTRKEAYMKALGAGFSLPSLKFTVPLEEGRAKLEQWEYYTFEPQGNYMISVVLEDQTNKEFTYDIQELRYKEILSMIPLPVPWFLWKT